MSAARTFLCELQLGRFRTRKFETFHAELDTATEDLRRALPAKARTWGLARKLMNIFLRDALYTTYLSEEYGLREVESFLEIPLDSITAGRLRRKAGRGVLPRWKGVRHLTPEESEKYQAHAKRLAERQKIARVHLDTYWWGERAE